MARIKAVLTERRNAYIQAAQLRRALSRGRRLPEPLNVNEVTGSEHMLEVEADQTKPPEGEANQTKAT
jgi:hypothetical protein